MSNIKLIYNNTSGEFDIDIVNGDLVIDESLETAIIISLFSDRYATNKEELPKGEKDLHGWWGDSTLPDGDKIGSLLWTIRRNGITPDNIIKAKEYAIDALKWMITDGVAKSVDVSVARTSLNQLAFNITISKPDNTLNKYEYLWNSISG